MTSLLSLLGTVSLVVVPGVVSAGIGIAMWFRRTIPEQAEKHVASTIAASFLICAAASLLPLYVYFSTNGAVNHHTLTSWFSVGHYDFSWVLMSDPLSLFSALLCGTLLGLVGLFSRRYLHREPGYFRFYFLLTLFGAGVELIVLAASLDLVFVGWEIVGMTSAMLIAFFHERRQPVEHGLRAFVTYRFCDIGLLAAIVWTHHTVGSTHYVGGQSGPWSGLPVPESAFDTTVIGLLLLWATMGKSAQAPLGGWLPRAMEGPTPSSAIFYGAISVHLGPYLLLRASPILEASNTVGTAVIIVGTLTALHATFVGRVQTDIKSALAYASMTQVGLIFVEIGLGFYHFALFHMVGHATIRSLQILRSPSLLYDQHRLEQAMGRVLPKTGAYLERLIPVALQRWLYRQALERGYFDGFLSDWVIGTFMRVFRTLDQVDQRFTAWLAGRSEKRGPSPPQTGRV